MKEKNILPPAFPTPKKTPEHHNIQAKIDIEDWYTLRTMLKNDGVTAQALVEFGVQIYQYLRSNPKAAASIGVKMPIKK